jgi:biotin-dependent carboxylase-like uncharacterized protein
VTAVLTIVRPGPLSLVQDLGRPGFADLGVGRSGAADRGALQLANRLVGNAESAAGIEVTLGGLVLTTSEPVLLALTGAPAHPAEPLGAAMNQSFTLLPGERLLLGTPRTGLRTYLAVRGGLDVPPVLGSRATDVLAHLGPDRLEAGVELPVGPATGDVPPVDVAPVAASGEGPITLDFLSGPRDDWFGPAALPSLERDLRTVSADLDRVGIRLRGQPLERVVRTELPSEGIVRGAVQVPADGQPIIFSADHPTTGGYPVIGVLTEAASDLAAQLRPGQKVRFSAFRRQGRSHM